MSLRSKLFGPIGNPFSGLLSVDATERKPSLEVLIAIRRSLKSRTQLGAEESFVLATARAAAEMSSIAASGRILRGWALSPYEYSSLLNRAQQQLSTSGTPDITIADSRRRQEKGRRRVEQGEQLEGNGESETLNKPRETLPADRTDIPAIFNADTFLQTALNRYVTKQRETPLSGAQIDSDQLAAGVLNATTTIADAFLAARSVGTWISDFPARIGSIDKFMHSAGLHGPGLVIFESELRHILGHDAEQSPMLQELRTIRQNFVSAESTKMTLEQIEQMADDETDSSRLYKDVERLIKRAKQKTDRKGT